MSAGRRELYVYGAGGFGRETAWIAERMDAACPSWDIRGFLDDDETLAGSSWEGLPTLGGPDRLSGLDREVWVVCGVASPGARRRIAASLRALPHVRFATVIDPSAVIGKGTEIGEGCVVCPGAVLTFHVHVGPHCHINANCTVGHDTVLEGLDTLYPASCVSGHVTIGPGCEIGAGSKILQGLRIHGDTILGAGAVAVRDIDVPGTYVGVPVRRVGG